LKNLQGSDILNLLIAVDELNIYQLISHIQKYLIEQQTEFFHQNPTGILETVYQHETFTELWNFCLENICDKPEILFNSDKFVELKAPLLELLLKRDDLNMDEIKIWEGLLKWCFAQQNVINDPTKWNKEDITKIERSLNSFIPLIRFYDIKPGDFFYKVYYYKEILPQDLIHNLLEFHIVPNMKPRTPSRKPNLKFKLDSTLIESKHIHLFASWIDKKDSSYNKNDIPYEFKLLYCSNKDGFNSASFHRNCDNKQATIWIAKIQGSTQLIGGYNPLDWNGHNVWKRINGFIFNFTDGKDISSAKLGNANAIYCHNNYGPYTGCLMCRSSNKWCYYGGTYYPNMNIPEEFTVENYEVFQVIKQ
jgi:hypothetical protein